jgi:hypothetical protein
MLNEGAVSHLLSAADAEGHVGSIAWLYAVLMRTLSMTSTAYVPSQHSPASRD